jgi:phosphate:Na+ symporter
MLENIDTWKLLGGLGIFLFAMYTLEDAIKAIAGRSFKRFIREQTTGRLKSITSGTIVTAILQSSSAVSLMVLTFVGAGIMAMENAIGVIIGSNIGTTATAWIVATVGFKIEIEAFALPIIGVGGLILIFLGKSERYSNISKLIVAFGFLFMGLSLMKESVDQLATSINISDIPDYGLIFYLLIGVTITAAMQSSSATIAIILTGLNAGLLQFDDGAAMVIGANIGTTATVLIGGLRATQIKKRVAFSHLFFNIFSAIIGLILLWPVTMGIKYLMGNVEENAVIGIALFHTIFNVIGAIVFLPFIGAFSKLLLKIIPDRQAILTKYIHNLAPSVHDAALSGLKNETLHLIRETMKYNAHALEIKKNIPDQLKSKEKTKKQYDQLKLLQNEIFIFAAEIQKTKLDIDDSTEMNRILHGARLAINSAKSIKDVGHDFIEFDTADNPFLNDLKGNIQTRMTKLYNEIYPLVENVNHSDLPKECFLMLNLIKEEDKEFVKSILEAAMNGQLPTEFTSEVLLVNRAYIHSSKQLIKASMETILTEEEISHFEKLMDEMDELE